MQRYSGTVEVDNTLEGGGKIFRSFFGEPFQLLSEGKGNEVLSLPAGTNISLVGEMKKDVVTLLMTGPVLEVQSWERIF